MRLTGQTVDAAGRGVANASVWIDSQAVTSDHDGRFALETLIGRSYEVRAQAGDLIGGPQVIRSTSHSEPMMIELRDGPCVMVTVVDVTRAPIANASVRVIGMTGNAPATTTDAAGKARVTTHPGHIAIEATSGGMAPGEGSAVAWSGATRVTIVLREGFEVSGRVLDEARTPIPNARIYREFTNEAQVIAVTDVGGVFVILSAVGVQSLLVIDDEHAPTRSAQFDVDRAISGLEIVMKPGAVYSGHVVDADAEAVADARVYVDTVLADGPRQYSTSSDANGAFEIRGLPRTIGSSDHHSATAHAVADGSATDDVLVTFVEQRELRGQLLALKRIDLTGVIGGVVTDDTGAPVPNVVVNAAPRPRLPVPDAIMRSRVRPSEADPTSATSTRTNAAGEFSIRDLPAGEYGVWPGPFSQFPFSGLATQFAFGADVSPFIASATTGDTTVRLVMPRAGRIAGKVAFADTGELVDDFEVDAFAPHEIATSLAGERGAFDLRDLRPGSYRLQIRGPVFSQVWKTGIEVDAGQSVDVGTITIDRGQTLSGMVVDSAGRGIAGANVTLAESGFYGSVGRLELPTPGPSSAVTDAYGAFAIVGGAPNRSLSPSWRVLVRADHPSYGRSLPVAIPAGKLEPAPVTLTLLECGSIAGKLTRNGQPLGGASVDAGWPTFATAAVNADGEFVMSRLPAGPVSLRIQVYADHVDGHHPATVEVEAGKHTAVTLEVPAGTIKLSVIMTRTSEVAGAWVYLFNGTVEFQNYAELWAQFLAPAMQGRTFWKGDASHPAFERLVPGDFTVCTVPLEGDPHDQELMRRVHADRASVNVHCTPVRVVAVPEDQTVSV